MRSQVRSIKMYWSAYWLMFSIQLYSVRRLANAHTSWCCGMETLSALAALGEGGMMTSSNGNILRVTGHWCGKFTGEFPAQRPVTRRSFDVLFDLRLNKRLSKQSWGRWFETLLRPLWRHCNYLPTTDGFPSQRATNVDFSFLLWH